MLKKALKHFSVGSLILILLGSLTWIMTMVKSGWRYSYGLGFWGANGHDGIWHLALAKSLARGSLQNPVFAGFGIQNYHLGFDLLLALVNRITQIPINNLYFQVFPPILALLIGILTYRFVDFWTKSKQSAFWSTFFVYFGGSFAWILGKGESAFWSVQAISTLINPPLALSLVFSLAGLIFLLKKKYFLSIIFLGLLVEIKIYAGILVLGGLFVFAAYSYFKNRKLNIFKVWLATFILSFSLFFLFNRGSSSLIVFKPFWFLETMMGLSDRIGWQRFYSAMVNYRAGRVWLKAAAAYGFAFIIFVLGNFGTRIIAICRKLSEMDTFVLTVIGTGILIPLFFLQKGTPWNTIQFFYYSLFFLGILAGVAVSKFNRYLQIAIILLTVPTTYLTLKDVYLPIRPPAMLENEEISALNFLSKQPDGVVLTYPFDKLAAEKAGSNPPRPLYLYTSTAYVSAYSGHVVFLEDEVNLDITGYDWRSRRAEVEDWYRQQDYIKAREFLRTNNIKYVYWLKGQRAYLGETQLGLVRIFENAKVDIYMVQS